MNIENIICIVITLILIFGIALVCGFSGRRLIPNKKIDCIDAESVKERIWNSRILKKRRLATLEKEIFESISVMRNMISIGGHEQCSADYMISALIDRDGKLKPLYINMLSYLRTDDKQNAISVFTDEVDSVIGKEFAGLLVRWDEINPRELLEILISHQKSIKEMWVTAEKHREEMLSDIVYLPVVLNVMLIFINFIYVVFFLEQREMFEMMF